MLLPTSAPQSIVLDTNAVLDCWLFEDPRAQAVRAGVEQGRLRWRVTAAMVAELGVVLRRPLASRWEVSRERLLFDFACLHSELTAVSEGERLTPALCCTDRDDQKFLDLALHLGACWLVTRDRALLRLGRAAACHGVTILPPERWRQA